MSKQLERTRKRIDFIDALRGYVILMMLQGHTISLTLADEVKEVGSWGYKGWHYMTGITAPAFFFTSGMIFTYLLVKDQDEERVRMRLAKGLKRGGWLLVIGFILQMNLRAIGEMLFQGREYVWWNFLNRSAVLHTIGWSLIILVALFLLCRLLRWRFEIVALVAGFLAFVLGPTTYLLPAGEGMDRLWKVFLVREQSYFPVLQWVGFPLFGAVFGVLTSRYAWYESSRFLLGLVIGGFLLTHVGNGFAHMLGTKVAPLFGYEIDIWWSANGGVFYRFGEVLVLVAIWAWVVEMLNWRPQWLLRCGQETLSIFVFHIILLYGGVFGFGFGRAPLKAHLAHCLPAWQAIFLAAAVVGAFIFMAQRLRGWRERWPWLGLLR